MARSNAADAMALVGEVGAIASSPGDRRVRATEVLEALDRIVPHVAAEIVSLNPFDGSVEVLSSHGYSSAVSDRLHSSEFLELMNFLKLPETGKPVRMRDLPGNPLDNWAVADVLIPAGYREGMTMCLRTPDGRFTGFLNLSVESTQHPSDLARDAIASMCSALGALTDPLQNAGWIQVLLNEGSRAVGLDAAGSTVALPGSAGHHLLVGGSDLIKVAMHSSIRQSSSTFLWPDDDEVLRVRVVPCRGDEVISTVVSLDSFDLTPLSRRELEVLTLAAEGLSNQEISEALIIGMRTVATHVEHILHKLEAPNRAAAAAYALREGLILGRVDCPGRPIGQR